MMLLSVKSMMKVYGKKVYFFGIFLFFSIAYRSRLFYRKDGFLC